MAQVKISNLKKEKIGKATFEENLVVLQDSVSYLSTKNVDLFSSDSYKHVTFIYSLLHGLNQNAQIDQVHQILQIKNLPKILAKCVRKLSERKSEINFDYVRIIDTVRFEYYVETNSTERILFVSLLAFCTIEILLHLRKAYRSQFSKIVWKNTSFVVALLSIMEDRSFCQKLNEKYQNQFTAIILTLNHISKSAYLFKKIWNQINYVKILTEFADNFRQLEPYCYIALSYIASDDSVKEIRNLKAAMENLIRIICDLLRDDTKWNRNKIKYYQVYDHDENFTDDEDDQDDDDEDEPGSTTHGTIQNNGDNPQTNLSVIIYYESNHNVSIYLTSLLHAVYKFSIEQDNKKDIYARKDFIDLLVNLITKGNDIEIEFSLKVINQLCSNIEVRDNIKQTYQSLIQRVRALIAGDDFGHKSVEFKKVCQDFVFWIDHKSEKRTQYEFDVFLSYDWKTNKPLVKKIKKTLETGGLKVWFDEKEMSLQLMSSMATGIDKSHIFVMCVTENYAVSNNCEGEAQYAFSEGKIIIQLMLTEGAKYLKDWVKFSRKGGMFVDFTLKKVDYDTSCKQLLKLIDDFRNKTQPPESRSNAANGQNASDSNQLNKLKETQSRPVTARNVNKRSQLECEAERWTTDDVKKWIVDHNYEDFFADVSNLDGKNLKQLSEILKYSPQMFYQCFRVSELGDLIRFGQLCQQLTDLFN